MAPKAKRTAKPVPAHPRWVADGNVRSLARRKAVQLLNGLADELGVKRAKSKSASAEVEALVRRLEPRCQMGSLPTRLRDAVVSFLDNGGHFVSAVLPPAPVVLPAAAATATPACDAEIDADTPPPLLRHRVLEAGFRLKSKALMLTFNSKAFIEATWPLFLAWLKGKARELGARRWAACLERSEHAQHSAAAGSGAAAPVYHTHAYLWWTDGEGLQRRNTKDLVFDGVQPRVDVCTCQASRGRTLKLAACQGLWYVAVMKNGTVSAETNYVAWRDYVPNAQWLRSLWEGHKLSDELYAAYSQQFRAGHADRKRDLSELEADRKRQAVQRHVEKEFAELNATGMFRPARLFPETTSFVKSFEVVLPRRPLLAIVGGTNLGKSLLAADVLRRVGAVLGLTDYLEVTVEDDSFLDFADLDVQRHAGVLLDGMGDALVLKQNREVLQGRPKMCKAGRSPTMRFSTPYTLCKRAVVVTFDLSAANLHLFASDHWLSDSKNVTLLRLTAPAWETGAPLGAVAASSPTELMKTWTVDNVVAFANARDLAGPAAALFSNAVNGLDLLALDLDTLVNDARLTPFAARKVLSARDAFLGGK